MSKNVVLANSAQITRIGCFFVVCLVSDSKVTGRLRYGAKLDPKSTVLQLERITRIINCGLACSAW